MNYKCCNVKFESYIQLQCNITPHLTECNNFYNRKQNEFPVKKISEVDSFQKKENNLKRHIYNRLYSM